MFARSAMSRSTTAAVVVTLMLVQTAPAAPRSPLQPRTSGCTIAAATPLAETVAIPPERGRPGLGASNRERQPLHDFTPGPRASAHRDVPERAPCAPRARSHAFRQRLPRTDDPPH